MTVHTLRKSYGKNDGRCLSADALKAYMGHSEMSTTLTYYSKRDEDDDVPARWTLDVLMKGESVQDLSLSAEQSDVRPADTPNRKAG